MARNLNPPPPSINGPLGNWLGDLHRWIEGQPQHSTASFAATDTPNSRVTGFPGAMCTNLASASTQSKLWILGGSDPSTRTDQGWQLVRVVAP